MEELTTLQQGYYHLKNSEFQEAKKLFEAAIGENEKEPTCYIGLLLSENALRNEEELVNLPTPLEEKELFCKALEKASGEYKERLLLHVQKQKKVLEEKKNQYRSLEERKETAKTEEELQSLIGLCVTLKDYKNTKSYKEELERKLEKLQNSKTAKKKKKMQIVVPVLVVFFLVLLVLLGIFTLPKRNGVWYVLTLNGYSTLSSDEGQEVVEIEDKIFGISVTEIGSKSFKDQTKLEKVVLPSSVKTVKQSAFNGCTALKEVVGSEHILTVENKAFKECTSLLEIHFAPSATVAKNAFKECKDTIAVYLGEERLEIDVEE